MSSNRILVTAALPYINNVPHMGHIVGSHLPADIFYRYMRSKGVEALFIGGSDEHGTPSSIAAKELGLQPQQLVDRLHEIHQRVYHRLNISYDNSARTIRCSCRTDMLKEHALNVITRPQMLTSARTAQPFCRPRSLLTLTAKVVV